MGLPLSQPDVILLDLDDTIISFDGACQPAWTRICTDFVAAHTVSFTNEELYNSIQKASRWYWADPVRHKNGREAIRNARRDVVALALKALNANSEQWTRAIADGYSDLHNAMIAPLPGAVDALETLDRLNIRLAVVTNGSPAGQREKISRFDIGRYFEHIFIDAEIGYSKPDARIFQYALDTLHVKPEETWMVGDNLIWDVSGAQQLGIFSVWNDYEKAGIPNDSAVTPDLIVSSIYEMAIIIEKI